MKIKTSQVWRYCARRFSRRTILRYNFSKEFSTKYIFPKDELSEDNLSQEISLIIISPGGSLLWYHLKPIKTIVFSEKCPIRQKSLVFILSPASKSNIRGYVRYAAAVRYAPTVRYAPAVHTPLHPICHCSPIRPCSLFSSETLYPQKSFWNVILCFLMLDI